MNDGDSIATLKNLGPTSAGWLREAGVATVGDLRRLGPVVAYLLVKERRPGASLNLLRALAAGLHGRDWPGPLGGRQVEVAPRGRCRVKPAEPTI